MAKKIREEGHYTIKRVDRLPPKGNANWLYVIKADTIDKFYRWLSEGTYEEISLVGAGGSASYISNVALNGTDLEFTGTGLAFNSPVDLSSLGGVGSFPGFTDLPTDYGVTLSTVATTNDYNDLDNLPLGGSSIYTADGSLTGNRIVNLAGNTLDFNAGTYEGLTLNPTLNSEESTLFVRNATTAEKQAKITSFVAGGNSNVQLSTDYGEGTHNASIRLQSTASGESIVISSSNIIAPSLTIAEIDSGDDKGFITKEWVLANGGGGSGDMVLASAQTNTGVKTFLDGSFKLRNVANDASATLNATNFGDATYTLPTIGGIIPTAVQMASLIPLPITPSGIINLSAYYHTGIDGVDGGTLFGLIGSLNTTGVSGRFDSANGEATIQADSFRLKQQNLSNYLTFDYSALTSSRTITFPDGDVDLGNLGGTMASTSFVPYNTLTSTDGQAVVEELKDELDAAILATSGARDEDTIDSAVGGETGMTLSSVPIVGYAEDMYVNGVRSTEYTRVGTAVTFTGTITPLVVTDEVVFLYNSTSLELSITDSDDVPEGVTNLYRPSIVPQTEAETGISTTERTWTAERVAQAIVALSTGGSNSPVFEGNWVFSGGFSRFYTSTLPNYEASAFHLSPAEALNPYDPSNYTGYAVLENKIITNIKAQVAGVEDGETWKFYLVSKSFEKVLTDFSITTGTPTLTSTLFTFEVGDIGKSITIKGAGDTGLVLRTTISGFTDANTVTLTDNAGTTVSNEDGTLETNNLLYTSADLVIDGYEVMNLDITSLSINLNVGEKLFVVTNKTVGVNLTSLNLSLKLYE